MGATHVVGVRVWSITAPVAGFWVRRAVHELAVHRWDAGTIGATWSASTTCPTPAR